jgi:hypothetical protein
MATSTVTITRNTTSQLSNPLTVNFTVAGTAVFGTDYTVSGANTFTTTAGSIIIPANQTQASLVITTVADTVVETDETVIITINPTAGVSSGTGSVTYTITNDDVAAVTVLLLHFNGINNSTVFTDSSASPATVTQNSIDAVLDTTNKKFGTASLKMTATGVVIQNCTKLDNFANGDFTIQTSLRFPGNAAGKDFNIYKDIGYITFRINSINFIFVEIGATAVISYASFTTSSTFRHIALTKSGNTYRLFIEGVLVDSATNAVVPVPSNSTFKQISGDGTTSVSHNIDEYKITKGLAEYTANFIPPPASFGIISGALLVLPFDGVNGATTTTDYSSNPASITFNAAVGAGPIISNTAFKFNTTSLRIVTGAYLIVSGSKFDTITSGDFTIEAWISGGTIPDSLYLAFKQGCFGFIIGANVLSFNSFSPNGPIISTACILTTTFKHLAVTRQGNVYRLFIDGVLSNTITYTTALNTNTNNLWIGHVSSNAITTAYVADLRIVQGQAVYTATFTPPPASFGG